MSDYTDYMEQQFFSEAVEIRETICDTENWINNYLTERENYPKWKTREGKEIAVKDITDEHLNNLLSFLPNKNVWHKALMCEKTYRNMKKKLVELKKASAECERVMNMCF